MNPAVAARPLRTWFMVMLAWTIGGVIALLGGFIWAELATMRPEVGGQYAYLREAFHPLAAFLYGWGLLLVIQTGGMAAVAVTFARYFRELSRVTFSDGAIAAVALVFLTLINCLGVRAGGKLQTFLMVIKIFAILLLVACGWYFANELNAKGIVATVDARKDLNSVAPGGMPALTALGIAMVPVLFSYGGWQTSTFVAGEIREPRKNLPLALVIGVAGVVVLYLAVNLVCLHVLGVVGLANTTTPASDVMRIALGPTGARLIAAGIAVSTFGFLSQSMLTAPRVYFAMAEDGLFFRAVGKVSRRSRVPLLAIIMQGVLAIVIAFSGKYEQILNYVVSVDFIFFGLTAICIFVFRRRRRETESGLWLARVPGHPVTTVFFIVVCWAVVINTIVQYPRNTLIGLGILLAGVPAYLLWRRQKQS